MNLHYESTSRYFIHLGGNALVHSHTSLSLYQQRLTNWQLEPINYWNSFMSQYQFMLRSGPSELQPQGHLKMEKRPESIWTIKKVSHLWSCQFIWFFVSSHPVETTFHCLIIDLVVDAVEDQPITWRIFIPYGHDTRMTDTKRQRTS